MSLPLSVLSQSGPPKSVGGVGGRGGGGSYLYHTSTGQYLSQNAKRASARKDTGLDQSLFSVQLFRLRINIIKVCKGANKGHLGGLDKVFKIRDHHHRIHRQILRPNEGLILILAQS